MILLFFPFSFSVISSWFFSSCLPSSAFYPFFLFAPFAHIVVYTPCPAVLYLQCGGRSGWQHVPVGAIGAVRSETSKERICSGVSLDRCPSDRVQSKLSVKVPASLTKMFGIRRRQIVVISYLSRQTTHSLVKCTSSQARMHTPMMMKIIIYSFNIYSALFSSITFETGTS